MKPYCATIELKATCIELYFRAVMFIILCKAVVRFTFLMDESFLMVVGFVNSPYVFSQVPWLAEALLTDSALIRLLSCVSPQV